MQTEQEAAQRETESNPRMGRVATGGAVVIAALIVLFATGVLNGGSSDGDAALFCQLDEELELIPPGDMNPDIARQARADLAALVAAAPPEIRDDVEADVNQWLAMLDLWEEADWDESRVDQVALDKAIADWFRTDPGDVRADAWKDENCP